MILSTILAVGVTMFGPSQPVSNLSSNQTAIINGNGGGLTNLFNGAYVNVLQAGCTNDGVTDNYAAIQALVSKPGNYLFPPGSYLVNGNIYPTNGVSLYGMGATIIYGPTNTGAPFVFTNHNCLLTGFTITGNQFTNVSNWYFPCQPAVGGPFLLASYVVGSNNKFGYWNGSTNRFGLIANAADGNCYNNLTILGFNGAAILPFTYYGQSSFLQPAGSFSAIDCFSNMVGVFAASVIGGSLGIYQSPWLTNWVAYTTNRDGVDPQYVKFVAIHCHDNGIGFEVSGGNNTFDSCGADDNWIQIYGGGGSNPSGVSYHGRYVNGTINHDRALSIVLNGATTGFNIANCGLACLNYNFSSCGGVRIHGCDMAASPAVTNAASSGGYNEMFDNTYATSGWSTNAINSDGYFRAFNNHYRDNLTDNDGAASTAIIYGGNGSGLTNLPPQTNAALATLSQNNGVSLTNLQAGSLVGSGTVATVTPVNTTNISISSVTGNAQNCRIIFSITNNLPLGGYTLLALTNASPPTSPVHYYTQLNGTNGAYLAIAKMQVGSYSESTNGCLIYTSVVVATAVNSQTTNVVLDVRISPN